MYLYHAYPRYKSSFGENERVAYIRFQKLEIGSDRLDTFLFSIMIKDVVYSINNFALVFILKKLTNQVTRVE